MPTNAIHALMHALTMSVPMRLPKLSVYVETAQRYVGVTASFVASNSEVAKQVVSLCADICKKCAEVCSQDTDIEKETMHCAKICRDCEEACRSYK